MIDTSTEAVTKLLDGVTPGPWDSEYDDYGEEIWFGGEGCGTWTVGPCFIGGDGHDPDLARIMDADAHFIAAARDLVPALLAERDALRRENENLRQIERNVQAVREHEYKRAEAALAEVERLKAQPVTVQDAARVPEIKALIDALKPFADIGVSENPDFQPIIRMDRDAIIAARAALRAITEGKA